MGSIQHRQLHFAPDVDLCNKSKPEPLLCMHSSKTIKGEKVAKVMVIEHDNILPAITHIHCCIMTNREDS